MGGTSPSLHAFFEGLKDHAFLCTHGEWIRAFRDDNEEVQDLPTSWTKRTVFARWLDACGWSIKTDAIGRVTVSEKDDFTAAARIPYCSWAYFMTFWKTNYGYLVVPKSREDICGDCFIFMNAHKYRKPKPENNKDGLTSSEDDEDEDDQDIMDMDEREARITKTFKHVEHSKKQSKLLNLKVQEARDNAALEVPHRL